ncbi:MULTISPECIES: type VII secretion integral membrane protein EccD [unclassified Streptomyces]|uniref:type VII secretion integral membrane protein EccD n=1 Tax=Streptomyces sp. T21Q-yed TaxID=3018441 RepID=UPI0023668977|nr:MULTISPECIES: type VII secretion integral membrane protein EccD [unclassified Streptomyces]MDF3141141.1 type VII secretion integral membrane protein EccD [Streptomyces sp. T21Q-yed]WDF44802.1 type VII secretion integral membrane protein EccD [Streptomyces sp. T12]
MPTARSTGFRRIIVAAPDSRIDVALPDDIPLAHLYAEILRLSGQSPAPGAPVGYHLVRRDGTVLDGARSLATQRVVDGEFLLLRPFSDSLPPAVFDDVSHATASAVTRDRALWNDELLRSAGLFGGCVLLMLLAFVAWSSDVRHDMHGLPGIVAGVSGVVLLALAAVRARVYDDRGSSLAFGTGALANLGVAGSGLLALSSEEGIGRLQFLLACAAVLVGSAVLVILTPSGDSPFVAFVFASAIGMLLTFMSILTEMRPVETAAVCSPLALGTLAFLPGLATRFARLPIGFDPPRTAVGAGYDDADTDTDGAEAHAAIDAERIAAQARRGHELLLGLVGGCALVAAAAAAVLGFSDDLWAQLLALATGLALLMRAHLFRHTVQVGCTLAAGLASLVLLGLGLSLNPPGWMVLEALRGDGSALYIRLVWLSVAVAVVAGAIAAIALVVPSKGVTPFWGRFLEIAESFVLLTLLPLCLAVFGAYHQMRSLSS